MSVAMRARRCLLLAFFAYILLDLGCPFVPGAFTFDPAESVDAAGAYRARPGGLPRAVAAPVTPAVLPLVARPERSLAGATPVFASVRWEPHATRDRVGASDPAPSADDA